MDIKFEILDRELDTIFYGCPRNELGNIQVKDLIEACTEKYAEGQQEIKAILSRKLDPSGINPYISKHLFKSKVKEWMMSTSSSVEINYESYPGESTFPEYSSTSIPNKVHFSYEDSEDGYRNYSDLHSALLNIKVLEEKNMLLKNNISKSEQKISSLEGKLTKLYSCSSKKLLSYERDNFRLTNMYTELQNNCSKLKDENTKLSNKNSKLLTELKGYMEFKQNYDKMEMNFNEVNEKLIKKSCDLKDLEVAFHHMQFEFGKSRESQEALQSESLLMKNEMNSLVKNQEELLFRIEELQFEKQALQIELTEMQTLDSVTFGEISSEGKELRESGVSINSGTSESLATELFHETLQNPFIRVQTEDVEVQTEIIGNSIGIQTTKLDNKEMEKIPVNLSVRSAHVQTEILNENERLDNEVMDIMEDISRIDKELLPQPLDICSKKNTCLFIRIVLSMVLLIALVFAFILFMTDTRQLIEYMRPYVEVRYPRGPPPT